MRILVVKTIVQFSGSYGAMRGVGPALFRTQSVVLFKRSSFKSESYSLALRMMPEEKFQRAADLDPDDTALEFDAVLIQGRAGVCFSLSRNTATIHRRFVGIAELLSDKMLRWAQLFPESGQRLLLMETITSHSGNRRAARDMLCGDLWAVLWQRIPAL